MAAGDLDGDGRADLVIGTPDESEGTTADSGEVDIVYGQPTGLLPAHSLTYDGPGLYHMRFGENVAIDTAVSPPNVLAYAVPVQLQRPDLPGCAARNRVCALPRRGHPSQ